jgi:hypothetical protein
VITVRQGRVVERPLLAGQVFEGLRVLSPVFGVVRRHRACVGRRHRAFSDTVMFGVLEGLGMREDGESTWDMGGEWRGVMYMALLWTSPFMPQAAFGESKEGKNLQSTLFSPACTEENPKDTRRESTWDKGGQWPGGRYVALHWTSPFMPQAAFGDSKEGKNLHSPLFSPAGTVRVLTVGQPVVLTAAYSTFSPMQQPLIPLRFASSWKAAKHVHCTGTALLARTGKVSPAGR